MAGQISFVSESPIRIQGPEDLREGVEVVVNVAALALSDAERRDSLGVGSSALFSILLASMRTLELEPDSIGRVLAVEPLENICEVEFEGASVMGPGRIMTKVVMPCGLLTPRLPGGASALGLDEADFLHDNGYVISEDGSRVYVDWRIKCAVFIHHWVSAGGADAQHRGDDETDLRIAYDGLDYVITTGVLEGLPQADELANAFHYESLGPRIFRLVNIENPESYRTIILEGAGPEDIRAWADRYFHIWQMGRDPIAAEKGLKQLGEVNPRLLLAIGEGFGSGRFYKLTI